MKYRSFNKDAFSMGIKMEKDFTHGFLINLSAALKSGMVKIKSHYTDKGGIVPEFKNELFDDLDDMHRIVSSISSCYSNLDEIIMTSDDHKKDSASMFHRTPRFEVRFSRRVDPNLHELTFNFFDDCELADIFRSINASMVLGVANIFNGDDDLLGLKPETDKED